MAHPRLLTRWICVCIALPASIVLLIFQHLHPWDITDNLRIFPNGLPSFPKLPSLRMEEFNSFSETIEDFSYALVLPIESGDNLEWIPPHIRRADRFNVISYVVNDRHSPYTLPSTRGGAAMAFLTYVLQHYNMESSSRTGSINGMADVNLFMRGKQLATYHDDELSNDASKILLRFRANQVLERGFTNLACELENVTSSTNSNGGRCSMLDLRSPSEGTTAKAIVDAWPKLFPKQALPRRLSILWGGQFAASREAIHKVPMETWMNLQQWLMLTKLSDAQAIEVISALWQYLLTGASENCPDSRQCYCDMYAICFADGKQYAEYQSMRSHYKELEPAYDSILHAHHRIGQNHERQKDALVAWLNKGKGGSDNEADPWITEAGLIVRKQIGEISQNIWRMRNQARRRGDDLHPPG